MNAFVMNTGRKRQEGMKGINVIHTPQSVTDVHGKGYVTVTLQRTRSASRVSDPGSYRQCQQYIPPCPEPVAARMTRAVGCRSAHLGPHRVPHEMVIVGEGVGGNQSLQLVMLT